MYFYFVHKLRINNAMDVFTSTYTPLELKGLKDTTLELNGQRIIDTCYG